MALGHIRDMLLGHIRDILLGHIRDILVCEVSSGDGSYSQLVQLYHRVKRANYLQGKKFEFSIQKLSNLLSFGLVVDFNE